MKIQAIMDILVSRPDRAGGTYTAFRYTITETGRQVCGKVGRGCESNTYMALGRAGLCDHLNVYYTKHELAIREWERTTSDFKYSGCNPDGIAQFIQDELKRHIKVEIYEPPNG